MVGGFFIFYVSVFGIDDNVVGGTNILWIRFYTDVKLG